MTVTEALRPKVSRTSRPYQKQLLVEKIHASGLRFGKRVPHSCQSLAGEGRSVLKCDVISNRGFDGEPL